MNLRQKDLRRIRTWFQSYTVGRIVKLQSGFLQAYKKHFPQQYGSFDPCLYDVQHYSSQNASTDQTLQETQL